MDYLREGKVKEHLDQDKAMNLCFIQVFTVVDSGKRT